MNKKLAMAMGVALAGMSSVALAEESSFSVSGNVALTSDYVFRGVSQTDEEMAIQGGFDVEHSSGFYIGTWASNVDAEFYADAEIEWDVYFGWAGDVGPVGLDVGFNHFEYPGTDFSDNNTDEVWVSVSKDFEMASVGFGVYYSDDWYGTGDSLYYDLGVEVPAGSFTIAAHYGWSDYDDADDYQDYSIGVSTEAVGLGFDLTFTGTDDDGEDQFGDLADERLVFTVSKSL